MPRRNRHRVNEIYRRPAPQPIELPYTIANFETLLIEGTRSGSPYTHEQIKQWADHFWWEHVGREPLMPVEVAPDIKQVAKIAQSIEAQWDMYVVNRYELDELQRLNYSQVRLPESWFEDWLAQLRQIASTDAAE